MKAIAVLPGEKDSVHLREVPVPEITEDEVLVRSIRAGVCSTDREINEGQYGSAPQGREYLVLGHESCGIIESVGKNVHGFTRGQYVVRMVRRPCLGCGSCMKGSQDMCSSGNFSETGIKELQGCMAEYFKDHPQYLIPIPKELSDVAVLLEPLSVVEKVLRQAYMIQQRLSWQPKTALVLGAGPIGILQTMLLVNEGIEVSVVARSPPENLKSKLIEAVGASYYSTSSIAFEDLVAQLGSSDMVIDASGSSSLAFQALPAVTTNGVLCLTSITGGNKNIIFPSDKANLDIVLKNKVVFGSVNAHWVDHDKGVQSLERFMQQWPEVVHALFTRRVPLQNYLQALEYRSEDIKTTIEISV